ncbi:hypothetical protein GCM10027298_14380 [Epidermidibacterium keratini]
MEPAGQPQDRGDLGLALSGLLDLDLAQFGLDIARHRHLLLRPLVWFWPTTAGTLADRHQFDKQTYRV